MKIREYQLEKIEEARKLQQECLRLHMPCPPVLHWGYDIKSPKGETVEIGRGKANSYTRNAFNLLSFSLGLCSFDKVSATSFADDYISFKNRSGTISTGYIGRYNNSAAGYQPYISIGSSETTESIDNYATITSGMTDGTNLITTNFNAGTRKLVTTIVRPFTNNTGSSKSITEAGILAYYYNSLDYIFLLVRDVFSAISVANGQTITWTYTTEVLYPEP